eukprot:6441545-Amphidinium_carterae.1
MSCRASTSAVVRKYWGSIPSQFQSPLPPHQGQFETTVEQCRNASKPSVTASWMAFAGIMLTTNLII